MVSEMVTILVALSLNYFQMFFLAYDTGLNPILSDIDTENSLMELFHS